MHALCFCHVVINPIYYILIGCKIDNKCVTSGDTYEKKCVTYKCQRGGKECGTKIVKIGEKLYIKNNTKHD